METAYHVCDMEGDLITFYGEVRRRMTWKSSPDDFGPKEATSCDEEQTQDDAEYNRLRAQRFRYSFSPAYK